jgi:hypothetical protein
MPRKRSIPPALRRLLSQTEERSIEQEERALAEAEAEEAAEEVAQAEETAFGSGFDSASAAASRPAFASPPATTISPSIVYIPGGAQPHSGLSPLAPRQLLRVPHPAPQHPAPPPPPPQFLVAMASVGELREAALATMVGWAELAGETAHRWLVFVADAEEMEVARAALPPWAEVRLLGNCASPLCHGALTALREARLEAAHSGLPLLWVGPGVIPVRDPLPHLLAAHVRPQGYRARRPSLAVAGSRAQVLLAPANQLAALDRAIVRAHDAYLGGTAPSPDLAVLRALRQAGVVLLEPHHFPELDMARAAAEGGEREGGREEGGEEGGEGGREEGGEREGGREEGEGGREEGEPRGGTVILLALPSAGCEEQRR